MTAQEAIVGMVREPGTVYLDPCRIQYRFVFFSPFAQFQYCTRDGKWHECSTFDRFDGWQLLSDPKQLEEEE